MNTQNPSVNKNTQVFKDYAPKIATKLYSGENLKEKSEDINNLVVLLNWCFFKKNNFFISDFNKRLVHPVCDSYNKLKTNILSQDIFYKIEDVFKEIPEENIKTLRFILLRYINIYDDLVAEDQINPNTQNNTVDLCQLVTKKSIKNCVIYMNNYVQDLQKSKN